MKFGLLNRERTFADLAGSGDNIEFNLNCFYTGILSFEHKSDDDMKFVYPLRGLNTLDCTTMRIMVDEM